MTVIDLNSFKPKDWAIVFLIIVCLVTSVSLVYSHNRAVLAEADLAKLKAEQRIDDPYNEQIAELTIEKDKLIEDLNAKQQENKELKDTLATRDEDIGLLEEAISRVYLDMPNEDSIREEIQNEDLKGICDRFANLDLPCEPIGR